jgi:hypothetical protein
VTPTLGAVGGTSLWYLTRGSGVVALLLLTASMVLGILGAGRWESRRWPRFVVGGVHRNVSLLVLVFLGIHIATTVIDGFVPIGWLDAVIPFRAGYRPVWIGLGALVVDCLLAIVITSLLRVHIGRRAWRGIHLLSYACWPVALVHGLGAGTDAPARWMLVLVGLSVFVVLAVVWWRIAIRRPSHPVAAPAALAVSGVLPIALVLFVWAGPLQPDWGSHGARLGAPASTSTTVALSAGLQLPLDVHISGSRSVSDEDGRRTVRFAAATEGTPVIALSVVLVGAPDPSGGVVLRTGVVHLQPTGAGAWQGDVTRLRGDTVTASLAGPGGTTATCSIGLTIDRAAGTVDGTLQLTQSTSEGH